MQGTVLGARNIMGSLPLWNKLLAGKTTNQAIIIKYNKSCSRGLVAGWQDGKQAGTELKAVTPHSRNT